MQSDENAIRALIERWLQASRDGDLDTVLSLMTDDVLFLVPGRPPMDKAEFARLSAPPPAGAPAPRIDGRSTIEEVEVVGDRAFVRTHLTVTVTPPGGAAPMVREGRTMSFLRKEDGRWRIARDANLLAPVPGAAKGSSQ